MIAAFDKRQQALQRQPDDATHPDVTDVDVVNEKNTPDSEEDAPQNTSGAETPVAAAVMIDEPDKLRAEQERRGQQVQAFLATAARIFAEHELWREEIWQDANQATVLRECLERYVLVKTWKKTYSPNKARDWRFSQYLSSVHFIQPEHLDVKFFVSQDLLNKCGDMLLQINFFKTPRNKLICISNACKIIFNELIALKHGDNAVSADEFLPVLTYIVAKTNPPAIISNLEFIQDYRAEEAMLSSTGYFFTNLCVSIDFLQKLDPSVLSRTTKDVPLENEWIMMTEKKVDNNAAKKVTKLRRVFKRSNKPKNKNPLEEETVDVRNKDVDAKAEMTKNYKFWKSCSEDLTPQDIPELLQEYKRLALFEYNTMYKK